MIVSVLTREARGLTGWQLKGDIKVELDVFFVVILSEILPVIWYAVTLK